MIGEEEIHDIVIRRPQLTRKEKVEIIEALRKGVPVNILTERYQRRKQTIYNLRDKKAITGTVHRTRKLNRITKSLIREMVIKDPLVSATKIKSDLNLEEIALRTVRKQLSHYRHKLVTPRG